MYIYIYYRYIIYTHLQRQVHFGSSGAGEGRSDEAKQPLLFGAQMEIYEGCCSGLQRQRSKSWTPGC